MFRQLVDLALPMIGLNVLQVMVLAIDTAMVGRLDSSEVALTALSFATQLVFLLMVAMIGVSVGTVALVARAYGAGQSERVNHILSQATALTIGVSIAVAVLGNAFAPMFLTHVLGASPAVVDASMLFLRPLLLGTAFNYLIILYGAVFRAVGNTRLPFMVSLLTTVVTIGLNMIFIYGAWGIPAMGIRGAAIGTVTAQCIGAIIFLSVLRSGSVAGLRLTLSLRTLDKGLIVTLFRIGAPAALDMILLNAGFLFIIRMLGDINELAVAAHGIGLRIQGLAFVPGLAVSQATSALVGQALGAGSAERAREVWRASRTLCMIIMSAIAVILMAGVHPIVIAFGVKPDTQPEIYEYAVQWMRILGVSMPVAGYFISVVGLLQGAGATWVSLRINMYTTFLVLMPLSAVLGLSFGLGLGAWGVWLGFPLSTLVKAIWADIAYRRNTWVKLGADV